LDLIRVADMWEENQESLKQHLGESDLTAFGAHWVVMSQVPLPKFNHVSKIRLADEDVPELIAVSRAFFRSQGLPSCCIMTTPATRPANLPERLYRLGFVTETSSVMVWDQRTDIRPVPGVRVERAPVAQAGMVFDLIRQVFFPDVTDHSAKWLRRGIDVSFEIGATNYIAYWGREPVGAGTLFCRAGMGGIYNMCTLPEFQGRGVARSVMQACVTDAFAQQCTEIGLTPTAAGRPLYERLGFRELYQERYFVERL